VRETQTTKVVSDELQATEADGFSQSKADAGQVAIVGNEREFH
jgi:hypothetical protein